MIQRIQSLYLILIILLSLLLFKGGILNFADESHTVIKVTLYGILRDTGGQNSMLLEKSLPLSAVIILIPLISLLTIFFFKNRKIQLLFSLSVILLAIGLIIISFFYIYIIITRYHTSVITGFKMFIPILMLIFAVLAYRGIRSDERLVKSYDRLR